MSNYYILDNLFEGVKRSVNFMRKRLGGYANDVAFNPLEAAREDLGDSSFEVKVVDRKDYFCCGGSFRNIDQIRRHYIVWIILT